jgi:hypothetical protein
MFKEFTRLKRKIDHFVLNVRNSAQCPEPLHRHLSALHVINGPTSVAPNSETADLMTILTFHVCRLMLCDKCNRFGYYYNP